MVLRRVASLVVMALCGCSSADAPLEGGVLEGGVIEDAGVDVAVIVADVAATEGGTCDDCGSRRFTAECTAAQMACLNDVGCAAIRNCVFTGVAPSMPCALDATGPSCVDSCIVRTCTDANSVTLYRALDSCAYCSTCASSCSAYCSSFTDAGAVCPAH